MSRDLVLRRTVLLLMHWLLSTYGWVKVCIQIPISRPLEIAIYISKSIDFNLKFMGKINPGFLSNILCKKLDLKDLSSDNMNFPKVKMTDLSSIRKVRIYVLYGSRPRLTKWNRFFSIYGKVFNWINTKFSAFVSLCVRNSNPEGEGSSCKINGFPAKNVLKLNWAWQA